MICQSCKNSRKKSLHFTYGRTTAKGYEIRCVSRLGTHPTIPKNISCNKQKLIEFLQGLLHSKGPNNHKIHYLHGNLRVPSLTRPYFLGFLGGIGGVGPLDSHDNLRIGHSRSSLSNVRARSTLWSHRRVTNLGTPHGGRRWYLEIPCMAKWNNISPI